MTTKNLKASPTQNTPAPTPRRAFRLTYSNTPPDDEPKLFQCRDSMAFCELHAALARLGYDFATSIYLYPDDERDLVAFPAFQPTDILVLTTRPPLNPKDAVVTPGRKVIRAANSAFEELLFQPLTQYFEHCTRKYVQLTKHGIDCLRIEQPKKWGCIEFYEYGDARIRLHHVGPETIKPEPGRHSTIAFFVRVNGLPGINCDSIVSFGMNGYGTLIWNRIIRTRYAAWVASPRFVMAELIFKKPMPEKPLTPVFADDDSFVEVRLLT